MDPRDDRARLFTLLARPETAPAFFARVADDVGWTVEGTHPLAGRYRTKQALTEATVRRLAPLVPDAMRLELQRLVVDGTTAVAELHGACTAPDGGRYDNTLCWVCRVDSSGPGAVIVEVREYLDSAMVAWTLLHNERRALVS